MSIKVVYSTEALIDKNEGKTAKQFESTFASLEEAIAAPLPQGYVSAYIPIETGYHVFSDTLGWEFHKKE